MARTRNFETPTEGRTMTHVHGQGENHVADGVCRSYETSLLPARDRHPVSTFPRSNVLTCARILILHASKLIIFPQFSRISMLSTSIQFRIDSLCYWNFNQKSVVSSSIVRRGVFKRFGSGRKIGVQLGESREEAFVSHKWQRLGAQRPIERWSRGVPEKRRTRLHSRCKAKQARVIMRISYFETSPSPRASLLPARRPPLSRPP